MLSRLSLDVSTNEVNSIIIFHDSSLIYKSLKIIMLYLEKANVGYTFFKRVGSEMSAFIFGEYRASDLIAYLGKKEDEVAFFATAEADRIKQQFRNQAHVHFAPSKILKLQNPFAIEVRLAWRQVK